MCMLNDYNMVFKNLEILLRQEMLITKLTSPSKCPLFIWGMHHWSIMRYFYATYNASFIWVFIISHIMECRYPAFLTICNIDDDYLMMYLCLNFLKRANILHYRKVQGKHLLENTYLFKLNQLFVGNINFEIIAHNFLCHYDSVTLKITLKSPTTLKHHCLLLLLKKNPIKNFQRYSYPLFSQFSVLLRFFSVIFS